MSKHTPGPWLYRGKSDSVHEACSTHPFGRQIFRFVEDQAPSDADLDLMLAAPELLEAVERLQRINCPLTGNPSHQELVEFWEYEKTQGRGEADDQLFVLAAVAKARGEAQ